MEQLVRKFPRFFLPVLFALGLFFSQLDSALAAKLIGVADDADRAAFTSQESRKGPKPGEVTALVNVTGTISYISSNYIAIEYAYDPIIGRVKEIGFPLGGVIKMEGLSDVSSLRSGDTVELSFTETLEDHEVETDGRNRVERLVVERKLKKIRFLLEGSG